jgi:D-alanyl-D-alanine carboxypeptidase
MNRIYLTPRKNKPDNYRIRDILDDKKLGTLKHKNNKITVKLKSRYNSYSLKQEAKLSFEGLWANFYQQFLCDYNKVFTEIEHYYDLPIFIESCRLKTCEPDLFNRPTLLHPAAKKAWLKMKNAAYKDNVDLKIISAYRSLDYQKQLINNKLAKGINIDSILKVNTLPGYSEHHTGCAIDIGSQDAPILEPEFDQSLAFKWLTYNAAKFNFVMSYPKDNTTGICYEPWHWCFRV